MKKYCIMMLGCLLFAGNLFSQLCTGSLGDPVVHITFGNSSTPRAPLRDGVTNMNYVDFCPDDGNYTITGSSATCFNNSWFSFSTDHTGDPGGRVMLINASFTPSDFYVDTVRGLCGNTIYEFATWTANVLRSSACNNAGIKPNLTFRIESTKGELLKEVNSGDIPSTPSVTWQQYGVFFTTPANTGEVVLRIRNNAPGGCGNDVMLDDITFRPCGPLITAYPDNMSAAIVMCGDNQTDVKFTANYSTGFVDPVLQWQVSKDNGKTWTDINGENGITFIRKPSANGSYQYRVAISERVNAGSTRCRVASNITTIDIPTPPAAEFKIQPGCEGTNANIQSVQGTGYTYQWKGPNGFSSAASSVQFAPLRFADSGLYTVDITVHGCSTSDSFYLRVFPNAHATVNAGGGLCEGSGMALAASGGTNYLWTPAKGLSAATIANPTASPSDTTRYKVTVTNQFGCTDSAFVTVNVWKKPVVNAGSDQQIFSGEAASLSGTVGGTSVSFNWFPSMAMQNSGTLSPVVYPEETTTYTLAVVSALGCGTVTDQVVINVYKTIRPPNVFSPNGDGINDSWIIPGLETYPESVVSVYNRTGQLVFRTRSVEKIWDGMYNGKPAPVATYYYVIDLAVPRPPVSGWVLVVR
jgi:gliding motility-associated-like protein